jgi:mannose-1-phosphate guanylyltransferase
MVLCAGLGKRLAPLTDRWPKPAVPMLGRPLVAFALALLKGAGILRVGINTFHLPLVMEQVAAAQAAALGLSLAVSREETLQGTGGGIRGVGQVLGVEETVVLNGDVLFPLELAPVLAAHRASGAEATMVLLPMPEGAGFNAVEVDARFDVRRIAGHGVTGGGPFTSWHFSGVHVLSPRAFAHFAPTGAEDINWDVYVRLIAAGGRVHGHVLPRRPYWSDLGTPQRYLATHADLLMGQVETAPFGAASPFVGTPRGEGNFWAHPSAQLSGARISGPAWFGEGSALGSDVRIGAAVSVGRGAQVGQGARLNRVAVLDGAQVEPGAMLEDCIVAPGGVVLPAG